MATEFDKVKLMDIDEVLKLILDAPCKRCIYEKECNTFNRNCEEGVRKYLESEDKQ